MLSIGLCRWYINITIKIQDIVHRPAFYLKHNVSETGFYQNKQQTPWLESASKLYRPSDPRLLVKLVPTFADRGCHVVSVTDPYGRILGFLEWSRYFFFQVAPQLYSRG
jgi:CBS-domain-containing membrane protein